MVTALVTIFPGLVGKEYRITSPPDDDYNCIAWAVGITVDWWWRDKAGKGYWPNDVPRELTLDAFRMAFAALGFVVGSIDDPEPGVEKIALFATDEGIPKHGSRQLATDRWTSKLGMMEDIEHDLRDIEGEVYGSVVLVMKRPRPLT